MHIHTHINVIYDSKSKMYEVIIIQDFYKNYYENVTLKSRGWIKMVPILTSPVLQILTSVMKAFLVEGRNLFFYISYIRHLLSLIDVQRPRWNRHRQYVCDFTNIHETN